MSEQGAHPPEKSQNNKDYNRYPHGPTEGSSSVLPAIYYLKGHKYNKMNLSTKHHHSSVSLTARCMQEADQMWQDDLYELNN